MPASISTIPPITGAAAVAIDQTGDNNDIDVINGAGAAAVNIQDGGNSITVDGSVAVSNFPATQPISGTITVTQATGTNLHTVVDSGVITSITNAVSTTGSKASTPAQTSVSVTSASTIILAANANRLGATIYNESGAICFVKLGTTASLTSYSIQIAIGGYYEVPFNYTGGIDGITAVITSVLRVTELTA
jgi:hypothetical protein